MAELKRDNSNPGVIAFYLPQFHPIPENDEWWGKGFTEWTNVGKAKPLFPGHYQPHVPADLGYYDLRLPETRSLQAQMAKQYGVDGFCYWHYWFGNGKRLLEKPFDEVLKCGEPDYPFCLGWANHSWEAKNWNTKGKKKKILIDQLYPGIEDCQEHFECVYRAFKDKRYITYDGKPVFMVWQPEIIDTPFDYLTVWRELANKKGLKGIIFVGFTYYKNRISKIKKLGYDYVVYDGLYDSGRDISNYDVFYNKILNKVFQMPLRINHKHYQNFNLKIWTSSGALPCIIPNWDHTPRSGKNGVILKSSPSLFEKFLKRIISHIQNKKIAGPFLFVKSWNEWGEGNHLEPDLKYGHKYLEALKRGLFEQ
jgi:hypothetical protein